MAVVEKLRLASRRSETPSTNGGARLKGAGRCEDRPVETNGDRPATLQELTDLVSSTLAKDHDVDRAVRAALDRDPSPIQVIKALRASTGIGLAEAKPIVDRNLPRDVREATERLRDAAWEAAQQIDDEARSPES
jgi:hypothetical protein